MFGGEASHNKKLCLSGVYVLPKNEMNDERSVAIPMKIAIAMMTKKIFLFQK